jgi:hypothetical protein
MDELFKLLGLGTPFLYAGATYGLFHWLDVSASDEAKEALSTLIRVREYDKTKVSSAILEVFDRIYTHPLLTFRAFLRSTMITVLITGVFAYELWDAVIDERTKPWIVEHKYAFTVMMASMLSATSISDYLSLFIIRYLLVVSSRRPIVALLTSSLIAVLILIVAGILRVMFSSFYLDLYVIQEPLTEAVLI